MIQKPMLAQFTGTENWYRHGLVKKVLYTDGIKALAEEAGAFWLLDEIAFAQTDKKVIACPAQFWILKVNQEDNSAVLEMQEDQGMPLVVNKKIPYTDFPLEEQKVWVMAEGDKIVLLLPSEY